MARHSVTTKIGLGLAAISVIGLAAMLIIYVGLNAVVRAMHKVAREEGPFNAAAYEMEVNVNGIGLAVLKYLSTRDPQYRAWVADDHLDFGKYHASYLGLAGTAEERELGERVGALYAEFKGLGDGLMQKRDQLETLFTRVSTGIQEIDSIIDRRLNPAIDRGASSLRGKFEKSVASTDLEAEIAEVGFWVANYQRIGTPESRAFIFSKLDEFRAALAGFNKLDLEEDERRPGDAIQRAFEETEKAIKEFVALEDLIVKHRGHFIDQRAAMDHLLDEKIQPLALLALEHPKYQAEQTTLRVQKTLLFLIPLFLFSASFAGFFFARSILRPLHELHRGTEAVSRGDLAHRIRIPGHDEFGDLALRFNRMTEQLETTTVSKSLLLESEAKLRKSVTDLRREIGERERGEEERARLESDLRRNETMSAMGALTVGVAHEVRNPLFGISSTLDALEARFSGRAEFQRYIDVLRGEVNRMSKLMGDLLEYGKPAALELSPGSAGELIVQAVNACKPLAESCGVAIADATRTPLPPVLADHRRLAQVFQNLLENAIHYSPRGGTVTIAAEAVDHAGQAWVDFAIRDSGPGFKPEDLPHIFEPFFTRRPGGTGLGLSIVLRIVEAHGGVIMAANRIEGGAVVRVRLPAAAAESREARTGEGDDA